MMLLPEFIYYLGYFLKRERELKRQKRLPARVISIGNLTVGGTGKTPTVIALALEAKRRGYLPVILTRGYKGIAKDPCFVSKGEGPLLGPDEAGDEAFLMAQRLKGIPIVKAKDRCDGGLFALSTISNDRLLFLLDDGYQHFRLFRDVDILLIDGLNPFGNGRLLPLGRLREPLKEMRRADIIVITRSFDISESLLKEIRNYNEDAPFFTSYHRPSFLGTPDGGTIPIEEISGRRCIAFCGLGNPDSFKMSMSDLGVDLRDFITFSDHHRFTLQDLKGIERAAERVKADWIITTEKDIIKITRLLRHSSMGSGIGSKALLYLSIDLEIDENFFEEVFRRL